METFRRQSAECLSFGSPFTAALIAAAAASLARASPLSIMARDLAIDPTAAALPFRLAAALHAAVLSDQDPALADQYPRAGRSGDGAAAWIAAEGFITHNPDWFDKWLRLPPQTNEVARSAGLLSGVLTVAGLYRLPVQLLELGASAGLNLNMERFRYRLSGWGWGEASPVQIESEWLGGVPAYLGPLTVLARAGCDQNPLDVTDQRDRLILSAYVWPDQPNRLTRLRAAMDLAARLSTRIDRADAADWIEQRLAMRPTGCVTLVYHSIFYHYPPRAVRSRIADAIQRTGATATNDAPMAWLRFEFDTSTGRTTDSPRCILDLTTWPGGDYRVLAEVDSHGRYVRWVDDRPAPRGR
jgi:hypothetical protein